MSLGVVFLAMERSYSRIRSRGRCYVSVGSREEEILSAQPKGRCGAIRDVSGGSWIRISGRWSRQWDGRVSCSAALCVDGVRFDADDCGASVHLSTLVVDGSPSPTLSLGEPPSPGNPRLRVKPALKPAQVAVATSVEEEQEGLVELMSEGYTAFVLVPQLVVAARKENGQSKTVALTKLDEKEINPKRYKESRRHIVCQ